VKIKTVKLKSQKRIAVEKETSSLSPLEKSVSRINRAFEQIKQVIFERSDEIEAIRAAMIVREHVMLEGKWGIAKSRLAREVFRRITGAQCFRKLLMKGTNPDEIFGPMDSRIYREKGLWEHNTEGSLPRANFAFLDEVYRASDTLLGSLLGILNEREFQNGVVTMRCPLISAIGTTNFTIDSEELEAFHDRWLIKLMVKPLTDRVSRMSMLRNIVDFDNDEDDLETFSLSDLQLVHDEMPEIDFGSQMLELFDELCLCVGRTLPKKPYISDRRLGQTARLVLASAILSGRHSVKPEDLYIARFGLCVCGEESTTDVFQTAYEKVVGDYARTEKERKMANDSRGWVNEMKRAFEENDMSVSDKLELLANCTQGAESLRAIIDQDNDERPSDQGIVEDYRAMASELDEIVKHLMKDKAVAKKVPKKKVSEPYLSSEDDITFQADPDYDITDLVKEQ
jgi:MoxR-like ATPase